MHYLYPILLCLIPVHSIYAQNIAELTFKNYLQTCLYISLIVLAGCGGLYFFTGNLASAELIFSINFFLILYAHYIFIAFYSEFKRSLKPQRIIFILLFCLTCLVLSFAVFFISKIFSFVLLSKILFWTSSFLTFFIILDIFQKSKNFSAIEINQPEQVDANVELPNVYHIILDAHAGFDIEEYYDEYFKNELEKRGFRIYRNCKSNYNVTNLSLPSILNMEYMHDLIKENTNIYTPDIALPFLGNNETFRKLRSFGYKFNFVSNIYFASVLKKYSISYGDYCNSFSVNMKNILLFSSLFFILNRTIYSEKASFRDSDKDFYKLIRIYKKCCKEKNEKPVYNYFHIIAPHSPYYFDENGKPNLPDDYEKNEMYFGYLKYTNKKCLEIIDTIKANMKKNSIIIVHSDHGPHGCESKYNVLLTAYFPNENDYDCIQDNSTLVNLFKGIFNQFYGENYKTHKDRFFKSNNIDFKVEEVNE